MAKLSAYGCHKVAGFRVAITDNLGADPDRETWYHKFALRSDGTVLQATAQTTHKTPHMPAYTNGGSYAKIGKLGAGKPVTAETLETYLVKRYGADNVTRSAT